jgi:hypothetical protein
LIRVTNSLFDKSHRINSVLLFTMRFENWDVLLFPQVSGTPIQEFRTECFGVVIRTSKSRLHMINAN